MDTNRRPEDGTHTSFWQAHSRCILVAAAVLLVAAAAAFLLTRTPADQAVDHITAVYVGDTKAGTVLDSSNPDFVVTAYFKDGHDEKVTGWTIESPQTLEDTKKSVVTITYKKASTQCEVQCTTGLIQSITAEYDGDTKAGTKITDETPGLHVYAIRDGKKTPLEGGWRVNNPTVLEKDTLSTINISYEDFSCSISIQCTTRSISRLTASYLGSKEEGTVLSSGIDTIKVTAHYADGTEEEVTDWTLSEAVTLEPKQRYLLEVHFEDAMCVLEVTCSTPTPEEFQSGCLKAGYFSRRGLSGDARRFPGPYVRHAMRRLHQIHPRRTAQGRRPGQNIRHVQGCERPSDGRLFHDHAGNERRICGCCHCEVIGPRYVFATPLP